jgi:8-oxo-dGTP pyrophosphatase MutT (NUDIX family)
MASPYGWTIRYVYSRHTTRLSGTSVEAGCPASRVGAYDWRMSSGEDRFGETQDRVRRVIAEALAAAEGAPDDDTAYQRASWLVDVLGASTTASGRMRAQAARRMKESAGLSIAQLGERLGVSKARAADMLRVTAAREPEPPPVVAAIVTSELGVLAGRRNDQTPPWTFIAGQIQPGESPADAAVREVKEETCLDVTPGRVLGRRVHPATGRTMIYLAAKPVSGTDVGVGDENELAEVRWLDLATADELLPGMYQPVRAYLGRALRPRHVDG